MNRADKESPDVHLNLNVRGLPLSATLRINELSNQMSREGRQVYRMGLGQSPFPVPDSVQEELRANAHQKDYLPVMGLSELRNEVSDYILRTEGVHYGPENVMIGPGSKELMFIVQLAYYGDLVIPTPSWVSYAPQASIIGRHIRWLDTDISTHWKLMPMALEALCRSDPERPRLIILNYPANPHGCTYSVEELKTLAELARHYKLVLLSDEIYSGLHHEGKHVSISRFYPEGTIISNGISKWAGAGGWRLGAFAFPKELSWLRDAMATVASETFTSTAAPIQYAAIRAFEGGSDIDHYLKHTRRILKALGGLLTERLREDDIALADPQGAFYLFPDFESYRDRLKARGITTSDDLCRSLLADTGVAILPGTDFGRSPTELTVRLAYVDFDGESALQASEQVPANQSLDEAYLRIHCNSCIEAVARVREWLAK
ncbi:MAG: aminotransferase class I/II-fold pyridoxal phosphate-dependent enzyme [Candidatus Latescibacteria bacterium]|nr:aminotransferase class I/II-fold pyridoxal phosphate-dependent enzyme [Candidatus Latescibacterota bacterium]